MRLSLYTVLLLIHCAYIQSVNWNGAGDWRWASSCDFRGRDLGSAQTSVQDCGPRCEATAGCTHFAWTPPSNCWMKTGAVSTNDAFDSNADQIVCGLKQRSNSNPTVPPPSPSTSGKCPKRGVAYTFPDARDFNTMKNKLGWWYNWGPSPVGPAESDDSVEFSPMVWTGDAKDNHLTKAERLNPFPRSAKFLLGFNEPNFHGQANLSPQEAARLWPRLEAIARRWNLKLVSPALNYCGGGCHETDPYVYFDKFFAACRGCKVDAIAFHWYGCDAASLTNTLRNLKKYQKPIWITEIACAGWEKQTFRDSPQFQIEYMKQAVRILENDPQVFRYAWFTGRTNEWDLRHSHLLRAPGQLTDLGREYLAQPCGGARAMAAEDTTANTPASIPDFVVPLVAAVVVSIFVVVVLVVVVLVRNNSKHTERP